MEYTAVSINDMPPEALQVVTSFAFRARFPAVKWKAMLAAAQSGADVDALDLIYTWMASPAVDLRFMKSLVELMMGASKPSTYQLTQGEYDAIINSPATPVELPMDLRYAQGMPAVPSDEEVNGSV